MQKQYTTETRFTIYSDRREGEMEIISKDILNAWTQQNYPSHGIIPPRFENRHWKLLPLPGMRSSASRLKALNHKEKKTILTLLRLFDESVNGSLPHAEYVNQLKATLEAHNKPDGFIRRVLNNIRHFFFHQ